MRKAKPSGNKVKFLDVTANTEYDISGYEVAEVEINNVYAKKLLSRMDMFRKMQKEDSDLCELYFWDNCVTYRESKTGQPNTAECGQLIVRDGNVQWTAYPKHTEGVELRTEQVYETELEELAKD
jgi:hypothetical protein